MPTVNISKEKSTWLFFLLVGVLIFVTLWLRLANLGYSNFQGDEIKALCRPAEGQTLVNFFLGQRKGPVQFFVTCVYGIFDPAFSSELAIRLPFAIAGILCVPAFYLLARQFFDKTVSIYAVLFFATNGLLVALSRIVQYQSITILCTLIGIYSLSKAYQDENWKISGLYVGFIAAAIGILAHFDGIYAILPMLYLLYLWWRKYRLEPRFSVCRKHLVVALGIFVLLILAFYLPFIAKLSGYQTGYWESRLTVASSSDTWSLFRFYNPGPVIWIYIILTILGAFQLHRNATSIVLILWALPPLIFMELIMSNAGTHFYTYLLPGFMITALGIQAIHNALRRVFGDYGKLLVQIGAIFLFGFLLMISHFILVDHTPEYPWQPRALLGMVFPGGNLAGTFGFPYNRDWRGIESWISQNYDSDVLLATNEKESLTRFYFPGSRPFLGLHDQYSSDLALENGIIILWVEYPQSWVNKILGLQHHQWKDRTTPVKEFRDNYGRLNATLYYLSEDEIRALFP